MEQNLVLTGPKHGFTGELNGITFIKGIHTFTAGKNTPQFLSYWGKFYAAYLQGSDEHLAACKLYNQESGIEDEDSITTNEVKSGTQSVRRKLNPDGPTEAGNTADDGSKPNAVDSTPNGDEDAGGDGQRRAAILKVLDQLDPCDDEQWTSGGQPAVKALVDLTAINDLKRADINDAAPDFRRPEDVEDEDVESDEDQDNDLDPLDDEDEVDEDADDSEE